MYVIIQNPCYILVTRLSCSYYNCRYDGHEEGLWLHCVRYSGPGWTYECPYPDWASLS